jgi:GrpB-like predicted nucleotidyltransferase (UPF0157 family)
VSEGLGLEQDALRLVDYDKRWPALFAVERERIGGECRLPLRLEHVGGTSIRGMCSKPVLDMAAGRPPGTPFEPYVPALRQAGYEHRGERGVSGRQFFCRGNPRTHHLHLVEEGGVLWRGYLLFRDYLRTHAEAAREFADVKRALAARYSGDREGYMTAKSAYVQDLLRRATERE